MITHPWRICWLPWPGRGETTERPATTRSAPCSEGIAHVRFQAQTRPELAVYRAGVSGVLDRLPHLLRARPSSAAARLGDRSACRVQLEPPGPKRATGAKFTRYQGKTVFLNIWATWCGPCVGEMPSIARLAGNRRLKAKNIEFVCVDRRLGGDRALREREGMAHNGAPRPVLSPRRSSPRDPRHVHHRTQWADRRGRGRRQRLGQPGRGGVPGENRRRAPRTGRDRTREEPRRPAGLIRLATPAPDPEPPRRGIFRSPSSRVPPSRPAAGPSGRGTSRRASGS